MRWLWYRVRWFGKVGRLRRGMLGAYGRRGGGSRIGLLRREKEREGIR